ncbi:hypothetical protein [Enterobacter kobei]|uniref:hypothetical protein n=1 Tax=Enterobacter kobei TaxID=208224 RepID=UPI003263B2CA
MTKPIIASLLFVASASIAADATVKSMAHATYMCGENGLVIKTTGLTASIDGVSDYKMFASDNQPATDNLPGFVSVSYRSATNESNWFSLSLTKKSEFISLTNVNKSKGIEQIGLSCQIVE